MIKLNLQQFVKTTSQMSLYRSSKRIAKQSMPGQPAKTSRSFAEGRVTTIESKKNYNVYEVKDKNDRNEKSAGKATGAALRDMIARNQLVYNKRERVWKSKTKKFVIRERK